MNYFQAYSLSPDETIVAAWDSQVAEAAETPWLAQALTTQSADLFPRFAACYAQLRALPRGARRALQRQLARSREVVMPSVWQRKVAYSLAGAALLLALGPGVAQAATITVNTNVPGVSADGKCSLIEAIQNGNDTVTGQPHADCAAGDPIGRDIIVLPKKKVHTLTQVYGYYSGSTGLPEITSEITIVGNGGKIVRNPSAPEFRLMAVAGPGHLTLRNLTLSGGVSSDVASGGSVFNAGNLTIENSTISGNAAVGMPPYSFGTGGGLYNLGVATIENSVISGNTATSGAVDGGYGGGIFNRYGTLTIANSTISGNIAKGGTAGLYTRAYGGGVFSYGSLTITNSTISGNTAMSGGAECRSIARGGGIIHYSPEGLVTIANSTISGNTAVSGTAYCYSGAGGGGISNYNGGILTITNSTISGNTAVSGTANYDSSASGGGIYNFGTLTIENSTISGNRVVSDTATFSLAHGGGVDTAYGALAITNSTISGNIAKSRTTYAHDSQANGGGVSNGGGYLTITNSTISGNRAASGLAPYSYASGGGIWNDFLLTLSRSLISGNKAPVGPEIYDDSGSVTAYDYNIFGVSGYAGVVGFSYGGSDIVPGVGVTLGRILAPLANNGGPTKTHKLVKGSPAIDAIPSFDPGCTGTDQRGKPRPHGPGCDIGAFER